MSLTLLGHPFSSYTWKAMIGLYANDIPFELKTVGMDPEATALVQAAHPAGKFPVLVDDDRTLIEATAIIEYLAVAYPGSSPLLPADPGEAVTVRMLDRVMDNYVMSNVQRIVAAYMRNPEEPDPSQLATGKQNLERSYRWLEHWLSGNPVPSHVSLFTCAAAPALFYSDWVQPIAADFRRLAALRGELLSLPAVERCVDNARPYRKLFPPGAPDRD